MAKDTNIKLRNDVIYSVYVRNHSKSGTFQGVYEDLERIKALGVDIIWFMPIHPIGILNKKGSLGCPYAIKNYREVNPEYGTLEDFKNLVNKIHELGMKCIIDVVYNHTSPDSYLVEHNPEYFYKKPDGRRGNKVGDWTDIVDLDYDNKELWNYQIETLKMWAEIVDGFRCDVASLLPVEFWKEAREKVADVNPNCLWLAESVHLSFIKEMRDRGFLANSDSELYEAFDICYDYDIQPYYEGYLNGKYTLTEYINMLNIQECIYPSNYVKLRFLENHDNKRAKYLIHSDDDLLNWTAFLYFQKGATLIYAGEEMKEDRCPSLFDIDKVEWNKENDISGFMKKLYEIKKNPIISNGAYRLDVDENIQAVIGYYEKGDSKLVGVFSLESNYGKIYVELKDGDYINLIDGEKVIVYNGELLLKGKPIIISA